jgi:hypothetical protein
MAAWTLNLDAERRRARVPGATIAFAFAGSVAQGRVANL